MATKRHNAKSATRGSRPARKTGSSASGMTKKKGPTSPNGMSKTKLSALETAKMQAARKAAASAAAARTEAAKARAAKEVQTAKDVKARDNSPRRITNKKK